MNEILLLSINVLMVCGQQTTGNPQTCTYSFLVPNDGQGPQSSCSGSTNSNQMKQLEDEISTLQRQVENLQKSVQSSRGRNNQLKKPSFNCKCGANSTVNFVFRDSQGRKDKIWLAQTADPIEVYCDFDDLDIAWTVLMRRQNFDVDFNRTWQEYKDGFGDMTKGGDFWLGLEKMHLMTSQRSPGFTLWIVMRDQRNIHRIAAYGQFSIGAETDGYELKLADYHGQDDDDPLNYPMHYHLTVKPTPGRKFETKDHKTESEMHDFNCVTRDRTGYQLGGGGWWFVKSRRTSSSYEGYGCGRVNLNAEKPQWNRLDIKFVEMRIRPNL